GSLDRGKLAILLSGRRSNLAAIQKAIADGTLDADIVCVISAPADAPRLERAKDAGLTAHVFDDHHYPTRAAHEEDVLRALAEAEPDFICLARYMRLLTPAFVAAYTHRLINIHPSLLPAFPGVDAQALPSAYGVKV